MPFGEIKRPVGRPNTGAGTAAERMHARAARHSLVEWRECADKKRRNKLEEDPARWITYYGREAFFRPFDRPHLEIIDGCVYAHETGSRVGVGAERGVGKSTVFDWMALYFVMTGRRFFPVVLPWDAPMMNEAFEIWKSALCDNDRLLEDYPEICRPFEKSQGVAQRMASLHWDGGPYNGKPCQARLQVGSGRIILPNCIGGIGGKTINGNPRGLKLPLSDGRIIRPDMILIDEPQDDEVANSDTLVRKTCKKINGAVAGMGQGGSSIPILAAGNFIKIGDVMDTYAKDPNWRSVRVACIEQWPDDWGDEGAAYKLWEEWWYLFRESVAGQVKAARHYKRDKKKMIAGMKISAPNVYKKHVSEYLPDVYCAAMKRYWQDGHESFMAERQQQPVDPVAEAGPYTLTPELIMARATQRRAHERPDWAAMVLASTDINPSYAFSTVMPCFGLDLTAAMLWYGLHKLDIASDLPDVQFNQKLFDALAAHGRELAAMPNRPQVWAIDAGGKQFDTVIRFAGESVRLCGLQALAFTGRGAKNYRVYGRTVVKGQVREQCHGCFDIKSGRRINWVAWQADYWKEVAQRACLGEVGSPGTISLPAGKHAELAAQICGDKLLGKGEIGGQMFWNWVRVPGRNDFGDALAQGYALAAFSGIGTGGQGNVRRPNRRRPSGVTVIPL